MVIRGEGSKQADFGGELSNSSDPNDDCLELHPSIIEAKQKAAKYDALVVAMKKLAAYPGTKAEEMSAESMRDLAREALITQEATEA